MNQILYVQDKNKTPIDIKKVLLFFAICLVIFGVILLTIGIVNRSKNNPKENEEQNENITAVETVPDIQIETVNYNVNLKVTHDKELSAVIYKWNDDEEVLQESINDTQYQTTLSVPTGNNKLVVKAIDINGVEASKEIEVNGEVEKPVVEVTSMEFNKIKVTITSQVKISSVYYKWNNEEDVQIPIGDNESLVEQEIDVPLGLNTLIITATDEYNNITVKTQDVKGAKKPVIDLVQRGEYVYMTVTDEEAVRIVDFTVNGNPYRIDVGATPKIEYKIKLDPGENRIVVVATNVNEGVTERKVRCTYTP